MIKDPEPPYNPEAELMTRVVLELVRRTMMLDMELGRPGPGHEVTLNELFELVKLNRIWIRFREGNPPTPELVIVPPTYQ